MIYKRYFLFSIIAAGIFAMLLFLFFVVPLFKYDPLQLQKTGYYEAEKFKFFPNMRVQSRGIIDNVDFDSVILCTSVLRNSSSLEASELLGGKFVNLALSDSNFYERAFVLKYLLQNKRIKHVIYSFDAVYLGAQETTKQFDHWELLYDENLLNDLYTLFDKKYIKLALSILFQEDAKHDPIKTSTQFFDTLNAWFLKKNEYYENRFGGLENWVQDFNKQDMVTFLLQTLPEVAEKIRVSKKIGVSKKIEEQSFRKAKIEKYINNNFLTYVKNNPSTRFYVVFPPYYRYRFAILQQLYRESYVVHQDVIRFMVEQSKKYHNLFVFGFEDQEFLDDIANYKDTIHYHSKITTFITKSISMKEHLITPNNIEEYLEKSRKLAEGFDILKLYEETQALLSKLNKPLTWVEYIAEEEKK